MPSHPILAIWSGSCHGLRLKVSGAGGISKPSQADPAAVSLLLCASLQMQLKRCMSFKDMLECIFFPH